MADVAIVASQVASAPQDYKLPGAQEILLRAVGCQVNGTNAAGEFLPALQMLDPAGHVMWTAVNAAQPVAAGGTALVSWFPGGGVDKAAANSSSAGGGLITALSSPLGTITVVNPSGPSTTVDLPLSGATAGTYGDATHTAQVQVNAEGVVTSAAQVSISGIAGTGLVLLFDSTLGGAAASIDTGANAIPTGHHDLLIFFSGLTTQAVAQSTALFTLNGDAAAHYDLARLSQTNTVVTGGRTSAGNNWATFCNGANASQVYPTLVRLDISSYDATTFNKVATIAEGGVDITGAGTHWNAVRYGGWRSTAAINQVTVTAGSGNLVAGSRLTIYGAQ